MFSAGETGQVPDLAGTDRGSIFSVTASSASRRILSLLVGDYGDLRDKYWPAPEAPAFFVSTRGKRLLYENVYHEGRGRTTRPVAPSPLMGLVVSWTASQRRVGPVALSLAQNRTKAAC